jgi:hypothetical protein
MRAGVPRLCARTPAPVLTQRSCSVLCFAGCYRCRRRKLLPRQGARGQGPGPRVRGLHGVRLSRHACLKRAAAPTTSRESDGRAPYACSQASRRFSRPRAACWPR